jgi:hypothetical protein
MPIRCLTIVVYEAHFEWHFEKVRNPSWNELVSSIQRLDKFSYPWVLLFIGDEDEDASVDCLTIMGGDGVYWLALSAGKYDQLRLFDNTQSTNEVELWTSDQGFAAEERYVTYDLDLVLRIVKHFGETSEPLPEAHWESYNSTT